MMSTGVHNKHIKLASNPIGRIFCGGFDSIVILDWVWNFDVCKIARNHCRGHIRAMAYWHTY